LRLEAAVENGQPVVERESADEVSVVRLLRWIERVAHRSGGAGHFDATALLGRLCVRAGGGGRDASSERRLHSGSNKHCEHVATAGAAFQGLENASALVGADQAIKLVAFTHLDWLRVRWG